MQCPLLVYYSTSTTNFLSNPGNIRKSCHDLETTMWLANFLPVVKYLWCCLVQFDRLNYMFCLKFLRR